MDNGQQNHGCKLPDGYYDHSTRLFKREGEYIPCSWWTDDIAKEGELSIGNSASNFGSKFLLVSIKTDGNIKWIPHYPALGGHGHRKDNYYYYDISIGEYSSCASMPSYWNKNLGRARRGDTAKSLYGRWNIIFDGKKWITRDSISAMDKAILPSRSKLLDSYNSVQDKFDFVEKIESELAEKSISQKGESVMDTKSLLMISMLSQGTAIASGNGGMNPLALMMLMDDKKGGSDKDLLPLLLLSGQGQNNQSLNSLLMLSMLSDDKDPESASMMKNAMLIQMFPDASDTEKALLAQGRIKTFLTMRFPKLFPAANQEESKKSA